MSRTAQHAGSNDYFTHAGSRHPATAASSASALPDREFHQTMGPRQGQRVLREQQQVLYHHNQHGEPFSEGDDEEDDEEDAADSQQDYDAMDEHYAMRSPHPNQLAAPAATTHPAVRPGSQGSHSGSGRVAGRAPPEHNIYHDAGIDGPPSIDKSWDDRGLPEPLVASPGQSHMRRVPGPSGPPSAAAAAAAAAASHPNQVYGSSGATSPIPGAVAHQAAAGRGRRPSMSRPAVRSPPPSAAGNPPQPSIQSTTSAKGGKQLPTPPNMGSPMMYSPQQQQHLAMRDYENSMMAATLAGHGGSSGMDDAKQTVRRYLQGMPPQHQMGPPDEPQYVPSRHDDDDDDDDDDVHDHDFEQEGEDDDDDPHHHEAEPDDMDDLVPTEQDWEHDPAERGYARQDIAPTTTQPVGPLPRTTRVPAPPIEDLAGPQSVSMGRIPSSDTASQGIGVTTQAVNPTVAAMRRGRSGPNAASSPPTTNRSRQGGVPAAPMLPLAAAATAAGGGGGGAVVAGGGRTTPTGTTSAGIAAIGGMGRKRRTSESSATGGLNKDDLLKRMAEALAVERERASVFQKELSNAEREIDELAVSIDEHKRQHTKIVTALKKEVGALKKERETLIRALEEAEGLDEEEADRYMALLDPHHPGLLRGTSEYEVDDEATPVGGASTDLLDASQSTTAGLPLAGGVAVPSHQRVTATRNGQVDVNALQSSVRAQMQEKSAQRAARINSALQLLSSDGKRSNDLLIGSTLVNSIDDGRRTVSQKTFPPNDSSGLGSASEEVGQSQYPPNHQRNSSKESLAKGVIRRLSKRRSDAPQDGGGGQVTTASHGTYSGPVGFFRRRRSSSTSQRGVPTTAVGSGHASGASGMVGSGPIAVETTKTQSHTTDPVGLGLGSNNGGGGGGSRGGLRGYGALSKPSNGTQGGNSSGEGMNTYHQRHLTDSTTALQDRALHANGSMMPSALSTHHSGVVGHVVPSNTARGNSTSDFEQVYTQNQEKEGSGYNRYMGPKKNTKIGKLFRKVFPSYQDSDLSGPESDPDDSGLQAGPRY